MKNETFNPHTYVRNFYNKSGSSLVEHLRYGARHVDKFTHVTCSVWLLRAGFIWFEGHAHAFEEVLQQLTVVGTPSATSLSKAIFAASKARLGSRKLLFGLLDSFVHKLPEAKAHECARVLGACSALGLRDQPALSEVLSSFTHQLVDATPRDCLLSLEAATDLLLPDIKAQEDVLQHLQIVMNSAIKEDRVKRMVFQR